MGKCEKKKCKDAIYCKDCGERLCSQFTQRICRVYQYYLVNKKPQCPECRVKQCENTF